MLNRHFSDKIFEMFFPGNSLDKRANRKVKHFYFHFWSKKFQPINSFFKFQAKTWRNVLDTDDDDADWLLGGAKGEPINLRCRTSLKPRPRNHIGFA